MSIYDECEVLSLCLAFKHFIKRSTQMGEDNLSDGECLDKAIEVINNIITILERE